MVSQTGGHVGISIYSPTEFCIFILADIWTNIGANYQFVCKNQIFDEEGRVIIINDSSISCEMLKINKTFFDEFNLWNKEFSNISWTIDYKEKQPYSYRLLLGFKNSPDVEEQTGFQQCSPKIIPQGILWVTSKDSYVSAENNYE